MPTTRRKYTLKARAERAAETHARIVEAIMNLHGEIGPRATTISAIAKRAGVERLTVYRHFKNEEEMFDACSHRYLEINPPPTAADWSGSSEPIERTRTGLAAIYGFFTRTAPMFEKIYRDVDEVPAVAKVMRGFDAYLRNLAEDLAAAWPNDGKRAQRFTIMRHAAKFQTWQSLAADGIGDAQKVSMIVEWLAAPAIGASGRLVTA